MQMSPAGEPEMSGVEKIAVWVEFSAPNQNGGDRGRKGEDESADEDLPLKPVVER